MRRLAIAISVLSVALTLSSAKVVAQPFAAHGTFMVAPSAALAFPTGRFGETDLEADPPKTGHESGFNGGVALGYWVSPAAAVGLAFDIGSFNIDFGTAAQNMVGASGSTRTLSAEVWARYHLGGGFARWKPYVTAAVGAGQAKGSVDYKTPLQFLLSDTTVLGTDLESTVDLSVLFSIGAGVLIPVGERFGVTVEGRARTMSTKGSGRTDKITTVDGDEFETDVGSDQGGQFPLKAKSNTDWWELRGGIVFLLK